MLSNQGINYLKGKKIAILGFGREGLSTLRFLKKNGIKSKALDIKTDKDYLSHLDQFDVIFRTPGFPRLHPKLLAAEKKGAIISSQIKLFFDLCPGKIIGITGTKGKTTTALLAYEILKNKYKNYLFVAGNFGKPALNLLPLLKKNSLIILELSSFQLQDLDKSPHIAVITNLTLDHMDPGGKFASSTHQTAKEYFDAKMNILKHQKSGDFAVIHRSLKSKTKKIGKGKKIYPAPLFLKTKLKGGHNLENIALAAEIGRISKVSERNILETVKNFKGVEHRLEFVKKINGVSFYNDSAATNPDATLAALESFDEPIHLILGGSDKGLNYKNLGRYILKSKKIKTIALIGQIKNNLFKILGGGNENKIKKFENFKKAVLTLYKKANKNELVLLSPAAASFGMFENYAHRGNQFKKLVKQLERKSGYKIIRRR